MIIELEINGARVIISGENLTVNVTQDDVPTSAPIAALVERPDLPSAYQIKALRKSLGLSQAKFARRFAVAQATVCRWELGYERPSGPSTMLLASMIEAKP
jgi:DNA-binding transcriptional regulator YiaG